MIKKALKKLLVQLQYPELRRLPHAPEADEAHLKAAMDWLCTAQDANRDGGVSASYDLWKKRWAVSYRETTGYIIETFLAYYRLTGNKEYLERAVRMGEWELSMQCDDGAVGEVKKDGSIGKKIFNTGQVMLGLLALYRETGDKKYLDAVARAARWLTKQQSPDGSWQTFTSRGEGQTIETRVAWPLLDFALRTNNLAARTAAEKYLQWVVAQQEPSGWFNNTSFTKGVDPWTHQIAYTMSGLLECYKLFNTEDKKLFDSFYRPAKKLLEIYESTSDFLPGSFDKDWHSKDTYSCLTGGAQLALVWIQIYEMTKEEEFLKGAKKMMVQLKTVQPLTGRKEVRGGILGSYPVDGGYAPYQLPNWAPKFFADALLLMIKQ